MNECIEIVLLFFCSLQLSLAANARQNYGIELHEAKVIYWDSFYKLTAAQWNDRNWKHRDSQSNLTKTNMIICSLQLDCFIYKWFHRSPCNGCPPSSRRTIVWARACVAMSWKGHQLGKWNPHRKRSMSIQSSVDERPLFSRILFNFLFSAIIPEKQSIEITFSNSLCH